MNSQVQDPEPQPAERVTFERWIEAGQAERHYWRDLWHYRELFLILAWRDVAVRYKQTVAGASWALVQPFLNMIIMTVIFGRVAGLPSIGDAPYALMVFAAMLPWQFFANALSASGQSMIANRDMITKVFFPRVIVPAGSVVVSLVDFLISLVILAALMLWFQYPPTWHILLLPAFVLLAVATSLGAGLILTALTVQYRDFRILVPFIVQFGMFVSPVAYSCEVIREKIGEGWFAIYALNPLVFVIEGFRWCILRGGVDLFEPAMLLSCGSAFVILASGVFYFRRTERTFADVV